MENENNSARLRPHILPPLEPSRIPNVPGKAHHLITNTDRPLRHRIGTPAPQKKSPIPDDLDLDTLDGRKGNPSITVESYKGDEAQKKYHILKEKTLKSLPDDLAGVGNNNNNSLTCRLLKKPQLEPIINPVGIKKSPGDLNGNEIHKHISRDDKTPNKMITPVDIPPTGRIHFPNKYTPLKPMGKKNLDFDENVIQVSASRRQV